MYREKQSKKRNNLQYIHWFMYIFIYIYLYSNFCSVFEPFYTLFHFISRVNLQLQVRANEEEVLGTRVPVLFSALPLLSFHSGVRTWATWKKWEWRLEQIIAGNTGHVQDHFQLLLAGGGGVVVKVGNGAQRTCDVHASHCWLRPHTRCFAPKPRQKMRKRPTTAR